MMMTADDWSSPAGDPWWWPDHWWPHEGHWPTEPGLWARCPLSLSWPGPAPVAGTGTDPGQPPGLWPRPGLSSSLRPQSSLWPLTIWGQVSDNYQARRRIQEVSLTMSYVQSNSKCRKWWWINVSNFVNHHQQFLIRHRDEMNKRWVSSYLISVASRRGALFARCTLHGLEYLDTTLRRHLMQAGITRARRGDEKCSQ